MHNNNAIFIPILHDNSMIILNTLITVIYCIIKNFSRILMDGYLYFLLLTLTPTCEANTCPSKISRVVYADNIHAKLRDFTNCYCIYCHVVAF